MQEKGVCTIKLKISEIFLSIQGEGLNLGVCSTFVRLSGCNLAERCSIPCDTKYAWKGSVERSTTDVLLEVASYNCRNIIITGGEPMLQQEALIELMEKLLCTNLFYTFEIETNGTIPPLKRLAELTDLFTVSPKFPNPKYSPVFSQIENLAERPKVVFKFVVDKQEDMKGILQFLRKYNKEGREVFLMPQATSVTEMSARLPMIIEEAKKHNFRVTPRLQILAYGLKRGV